MVLPWHTSRTAESPSHSYFSFLPSSLSIVSLSHSSPLPLWLFTSPVSPYSSPPVYCLCSLSLFLFVSIPIPPPTLSLHFLLSPDGLLFQLHCSSQIILFNTPSFYLKQTIHFLVRCFFTHSIFSYTVITLPDGSIIGLARPNDRIHPVLHSPSSEATATVPSLSHSDFDRLIKPSRVGTHRQQNPILSSTLATNGALSSHECMGSSSTSYNDNHMNDSSHSHPNDTPSCEPCLPPHTVHLPSIICNHPLLSSFHCSTSGRCLSSLDEQWVYACNTPQSDLDKHSRSHSRRF